MAKEDFCFTYYDGDAARDMQHMDRTCRGAYTDLIIMQRKTENCMLTEKHIKAVLGSDYEKCWPSLEFILKKEEDFFYIEWVKNSVEKTKEHSKNQAEKIKEYWRKVEAGEIEPPKNGRKKTPNKYQKNTTVLKLNTEKIPLEDGDGNGDEYKDELKGGVGEKIETVEYIPPPETLVGDFRLVFKNHNPEYFFDASDNAILLEISAKIAKWKGIPQSEIIARRNALKSFWEEIVIHCRGDGHLSKYSLSQINKYFSSITQSLKNGSTNQHTPKNTTLRKSEGAEQLANLLKTKLSDIGRTGT